MARTLVDGVEYQDYRELHIDPLVGVDDITIRSGDENSRFASATYALGLFTLNVADNVYYTAYTASNAIKINILVTGDISDSPTVTYSNVTIQANKATRNRHNSLTAITHNSTGTLVVNGIKLTNFTKQNSGTVYIENLQITGTITISGTGTIEFRNCDLKTATCNVTGAATVRFIGGTSPTVTCSVGATIYLHNTYDGGNLTLTGSCSYSLSNAIYPTFGNTLTGTRLSTTLNIDSINMIDIPSTSGSTDALVLASDGRLAKQTLTNGITIAATSNKNLLRNSTYATQSYTGVAGEIGRNAGAPALNIADHFHVYSPTGHQSACFNTGDGNKRIRVRHTNATPGGTVQSIYIITRINAEDAILYSLAGTPVTFQMKHYQSIMPGFSCQVIMYTPSSANSFNTVGTTTGYNLVSTNFVNAISTESPVNVANITLPNTAVNGLEIQVKITTSNADQNTAYYVRDMQLEVGVSATSFIVNNSPKTISSTQILNWACTTGLDITSSTSGLPFLGQLSGNYVNSTGQSLYNDGIYLTTNTGQFGSCSFQVKNFDFTRNFKFTITGLTNARNGVGADGLSLIIGGNQLRTSNGLSDYGLQCEFQTYNTSKTYWFVNGSQVGQYKTFAFPIIGADFDYSVEVRYINGKRIATAYVNDILMGAIDITGLNLALSGDFISVSGRTGAEGDNHKLKAVRLEYINEVPNVNYQQINQSIFNFIDSGYSVVTVEWVVGNYPDLASAVAAITDASSNRRYIIKIGNGTFYCDNVNLTSKPYISIQGNGINSTVLIPSSSSVDGLILGVNNDLSGVEFQNYGSTKYALKLIDPSRVNVHDVRFINCDGGINCGAVATTSYATLRNIWIAGSFSYGINCNAYNSYNGYFDISNVVIDGGSSSIWYGIYVAGANCTTMCNNVNVRKGQGTGSAYYTNAATVLSATGGLIQNCNYGFNFGLNNGTCDVLANGVTMIGTSVVIQNSSNSTARGELNIIANSNAVNNISSTVKYFIVTRSSTFISGPLYDASAKAYGSTVASNEYLTQGYIDFWLSDRIVICQAYLSSNQSISSSDVVINLVADIDTHSAFNNTTHRFTAPKAGHYRVSVNMNQSTGAIGNQVNYQARKNGNTFALWQDQASAYSISGSSKAVYLNLGDYIEITGYSGNGSGTTVNAGSQLTWALIEFVR